MSLFTQSGLLPVEFERLLGRQYNEILEIFGKASKSYDDELARSVLYATAPIVAVKMDDYMSKAINYHVRRILDAPAEELNTKRKIMEDAHAEVGRAVQSYSQE